jgi:hypothetical protein
VVAPVEVEPVKPVEPIAPVAVEPVAPVAVEPVVPVAVEPVEPVVPVAVEPVAPVAVAPVEPVAVEEPLSEEELEGKTLFDCKILQNYEKFIGLSGMEELRKHNISFILGTWNQIATSRSTESLGSGPNLEKVQAVYTQLSGLIGVENSFVSKQGTKISIKGTSRDRGSPYCRTVTFASSVKREGNYWILYISPNEKSFIVCAPIIVEGHIVDPCFGLYVLTQLSYADFWKDQREVACIKQVLKK